MPTKMKQVCCLSCIGYRVAICFLSFDCCGAICFFPLVVVVLYVVLPLVVVVLYVV